MKEGNYVRVRGNAEGTVWESGRILDIDENGTALIGYGGCETRREFLLIGMGLRVPLEDLEEAYLLFRVVM